MLDISFWAYIILTMYPIIKTRDNSKDKFRYSSATVLYSFQNCKCFYCNKFMRYVSYNPENPERAGGYTIDHLFPKHLGFGLAGNAVLACRRCNEKKDGRPPTPTEIVKAWELYNKMGVPFIASIIFP